ncbi:hypothetical protein PR048_011483 [Dryococelus australis]|uniref:Uncharacterized protein n=1 Tax=Dryococelus australis TaxID=614101 RepID=A0ABQ9HLQ0_9NEOP|nr:hypothetical protein PR048_011483 [Dryococelus australis]
MNQYIWVELADMLLEYRAVQGYGRKACTMYASMYDDTTTHFLPFTKAHGIQEQLPNGNMIQYTDDVGRIPLLPSKRHHQPKSEPLPTKRMQAKELLFGCFASNNCILITCIRYKWQIQQVQTIILVSYNSLGGTYNSVICRNVFQSPYCGWTRHALHMTVFLRPGIATCRWKETHITPAYKAISCSFL